MVETDAHMLCFEALVAVCAAEAELRRVDADPERAGARAPVALLLLAAEQRLRSAFAAVSELWLEVASDGCCDCLGSLPAQPAFVDRPAGRKLGDVFPSAAAQFVEAALTEAGRRGRWSGEEFELPLAQGSLWLELSVLRSSGHAQDEPGFWLVLRDVTARRQAAEAMRASEELYRVMFDRAKDGVFVVSPDGELLLVNASFAHIHGYATIDALPRNLKELDTPESYRLMPERMQRALAGEDLSFEVEQYHADGSLVPLEVSVAMISAGERPLLHCSHRDVSERRRAEEALRKRETELLAVLESVADGVLAVDNEGKVLHANRRFAELWRIPRHLIEGGEDTGLIDFVLGQLADPEAFLGKVRALYGSDALSMDTLVFKDGRVFERYSVPMESQGVSIGRVWSFRDVTERKRAEAALRESEKLLRDSQIVAGIGCYVLDVGSGMWKSSEVLDGIFGIDAAYAHSVQGWEALIHPDDRSMMAEYLRKEVLGRRRPFDKEYRIIRHDSGAERWVHGVGKLEFDAQGRPTEMYGAIQDITERRMAEAERRLMEEQLRESQKMEALGALAGGVAHDFNNILAAIIGNVELARRDVGPAHPATESLDEIGKAGSRAKELVRQILAFGRRQLVSRTVVSLAPVVHETSRLLRTTLPAGIELRVECAADAPPVHADATQVEQVILNLCSNSWHALHNRPAGGVIEVRLEAYERAREEALDDEETSRHGGVEPGRYARLTVRDNGSGMDEETLSRIFEPFFTTKPVGQGTGLGLAVVHGIVREHGASVVVQSAPGEGSTFRVYFPAVDCAEEMLGEATPQTERATDGRGKRVLFIDDDEAIVFLMKRLLERQGYRVAAYSDPRAAIAAVRTAPDQFDLAVTDYNMAGMSGLDVARELRNIRADLPVAVASGYITEELRAQAPEAGVSELIYKPNTVDDLCAAIARLSQTERP